MNSKIALHSVSRKHERRTTVHNNHYFCPGKDTEYSFNWLTDIFNEVILHDFSIKLVMQGETIADVTL
jgi:hypothetical protein